MTKEYDFGDLVEVHLSKVIYEGILLETPKSEKGIVLLKLGTGYNIGLKKKDILKINLLKKGKEATKEFELKKDKEKPNIAMIITGGTIAAKLNPKKGGVDWLDTPESLFSIYPDLFSHVNVTKVEVPFMKASEDMDYKDWQKIAKVAGKLLNDSNIKGLIITHGTDFLHYTSSALSFFLKNLNKPVVLTYSQRSIDRASSDANLNLQCAAVCAISDIAEVILVGHGSSDDSYCNAIVGTKVKKMHSSKRDAFKAINDVPIAKVTGESIEPLKGYNLRENSREVQVDTSFEEKVALVKIYPGQDPGILDYYFKNKYKGIVLEVSGLAHLPTTRSRTSWIKKLKEVQEKGIVICATVQTVYGRADPYVYSNGREIMGTGVIYLEDMLSETALVKLGHVLGKTKEKEEVKRLMLQNMAKEFNDRLN